MMFHIDESFAPGSGAHDKDSFVPPATSSQDPIAAISATEQCFMVARESGVVQRYSLPHLSLETRFQIRCRPQVVAVNCDSTRMSVMDSVRDLRGVHHLLSWLMPRNITT